MLDPSEFFVDLRCCLQTAVSVLRDCCEFIRTAPQSRSALAAENLFLRKQPHDCARTVYLVSPSALLQA